MDHFKTMLHTPNHDLSQFRRVSLSTVSKAADRPSKTSVVGSPRDSEIWISFLICIFDMGVPPHD